MVHGGVDKVVIREVSNWSSRATKVGITLHLSLCIVHFLEKAAINNQLKH